MWHLNRARRDSSRPIPMNVEATDAFYSRHDISREAHGRHGNHQNCGLQGNEAKAAFVVQVERSLCHVLGRTWQQCWFQHVLQPTSSQCASHPQYTTWHMTCVCVKTRENFISLTNALLPTYNRQWSVENADCRFEEGCMLNQCATCKDGTKLKEALQGKQESGDEVEVSRWQKATDDDRLINQVDHAS